MTVRVAAGDPCSISTDDAAISGTDLTSEYDVATLREIARSVRLARRSCVVELDDVDDRVAGVDFQACRSEKSGADIARPQRIPAAAVRSA